MPRRHPDHGPLPYVRIHQATSAINDREANEGGRCWDGKNIDSPDHSSHVSYPETGTFESRGTCPSTHPVKIPQLMFEIIWDTSGFNDKAIWPEDGSQPFTLSQGDKYVVSGMRAGTVTDAPQGRLRPARRLCLWVEGRQPAEGHGRQLLRGDVHAAQDAVVHRGQQVCREGHGGREHRGV